MAFGEASIHAMQQTSSHAFLYTDSFLFICANEGTAWRIKGHANEIKVLPFFRGHVCGFRAHGSGLMRQRRLALTNPESANAS